ncbi:MAG TPA: type I methionyl aminopeptidase, partial [Desulfobacterales bacterium]|nr:type I methionyl aminopeptidase [Desulfobacterales bacterium]
RLQSGDLVSIDFGVRFQGYYGDAAVTIAVGDLADERARLQAVTREALERGIAQVMIGRRISDISRAIQEHVEAHGFSVVRQFVGHGIGRQLHEPPEIPNYVREGASPRLQPGMVLAIEPMVNAGTWEVKVLRDGWTVVTADGRPSAHFEHSVAVTEDGPLVLSRLADEEF